MQELLSFFWPTGERGCTVRELAFVSDIQLMLFTEIVAVCSEIHTKQISTQCRQNAELLCCRAGLAYFNSQERHIIRYGLV